MNIPCRVNNAVLFLYAIFVALVGANVTHAQAARSGLPIWRVEPDTCLVSDNEISCEINVKITLLAHDKSTDDKTTDNKTTLVTSHSPLCVYLEDSLIDCFKNGSSQLSISVELKNSKRLILRNKNMNILAQHELQFSSLASVNFEKRTRLPWSLF